MESGLQPVSEIDQKLPSQPTPSKTRRFFLATAYFLSAPLFVVFLVLFSLAIKYENTGQIARQEYNPQFQALPSDTGASSISLENHDARIEALDAFFAEYNSPLEGKAHLIIKEADAHEIDYRLLPAIAMQESTLCKKIIKDSYNCWGFGIYGNKVTRFDSFDHAIKVITAKLSQNYVKKGYVTPEEIVQKYTPSDTGRWPEVVNMIMTRLKNSI